MRLEVKLDGEVYTLRAAGWMAYTHMGVDQLEEAS